MARKIALRVERLEVRELLSSLAYSVTTDKSTYQVGQPVAVDVHGDQHLQSTRNGH